MFIEKQWIFIGNPWIFMEQRWIFTAKKNDFHFQPPNNLESIQHGYAAWICRHDFQLEMDCCLANSFEEYSAVHQIHRLKYFRSGHGSIAQDGPNKYLGRL